MSLLLEACCWLSAACIAYTYAVYPLLMAILARLRRQAVRAGTSYPESISVVLTAYNEEAALDRRLQELTGLIAASGLEGEVIVVSDGSTDATAMIARAYPEKRVRFIELPQRMGKAVALTEGWAAARHEIVVFADARQSWEPEALKLLLENFTDPTVGAVSGDLVLEKAPGVLAGVGLYWRFEKWLRQQESRAYSMVSVTGAISAVRRHLFRPIPPGTVLDDVYWPLNVTMQGYRVVHDARARAHDCLPERTQDEFRRKIRTLSGNFQLLTRLPCALLPSRNPVWFQFLSHKVLRLAVPWALLALLFSSALLWTGPLYRVLFGLQIAFYLFALAGLQDRARLRLPGMSAAASLLVLNTAAWLGFWVWISGGASKSWGKVLYQPSRLAYSGTSTHHPSDAPLPAPHGARPVG